MNDRDDICYECKGYDDDYYIDENVELADRCPECPYSDDYEWG